MKRYAFLTISIAVLLAQTVPATHGAERPNIILIMADDLGWGDVGFNGNEVIKTPHLDAMAENGLRFTRFYTASPLCSATRGSCLTGRYPWRFGVLAAHTGGMRRAEMTVAEVARGEDYRTGFFGKWHLGWVKPEENLPRGFYSPPWQHGFDETFATTSAVPTWNPTVTPPEEAKGDEAGAPWKGGRPYVSNGVETADNMEGDDSRVIMDRVIPFLRDASGKSEPFLACVWFHTPHEPVVAGPEFRKLYKDIDGQALVENRYKLLKSASPNGGYELYDLIEDPAEKHDLAAVKPDVLATMKARMAEYDESCRRSRDGADYEY